MIASMKDVTSIPRALPDPNPKEIQHHSLALFDATRLQQDRRVAACCFCTVVDDGGNSPAAGEHNTVKDREDRITRRCGCARRLRRP